MSEAFFIGDTHFGHKNIINYSAKYRLTLDKVPFATIQEHDEALVERWNATVGPKDKVIHCGDFCFGARNLPIASRLNGRKQLVMGNHDHYASADYLKYFEKLSGAVQFESIIVTHIPVHINQMGRFWMNIHGHLHHEVVLKPTPRVCHPPDPAQVPDWRYYNVSCEQNNCTPVPYDIIIDRYAELHKAN